MNDSHVELLRLANEARQHSYAPYSEFRVGAALLTCSGRIFTGANVENASFGLSICAERNAVFQAVTSGEREFEAIAICSDDPAPTPPCGACRQVLMEFSPEMMVLLIGADQQGEVEAHRLEDLLSRPFRSFSNPEGNS